ncbi:hypothetical protein Tco_0228203 [Tanacetum coccineum]
MAGGVTLSGLILTPSPATVRYEVQMAEGSVPGINPEGSRNIRGMLSLVDPTGVRGTQFHANHWQLSRWEETANTRSSKPNY